MLFSAAVAVVGIFGAYMFYIKRPDLPEKFTQGQWGFDLVQNKYYIDELYDDSIVKPTVEGSKMLWKECDAKAIDGSVNGAAKIIGWLSRNAQAFQSGFVRNYALFMVVGFISLLLVMF
jgi:NADH-quinone oxidoreductase subunit L